ncbi:hypothetical protein [Photorhabdus cinerea]|uniref:hypothetical protein n=1 Tax=Photorhabdus cinerea TaxID=471575 RepID=UPI001A99F87A|nr:hypothetical protein [Photorhabdus cinerea]
MEFIDDKFPVRNKYFNELDGDEKANFFTLFLSIVGSVRNKNIINVSLLKEKLNYFSNNLPDDYKLAASEAVNNKKERLLRAVYIDKIVSECVNWGPLGKRKISYAKPIYCTVPHQY